MKLLRLPAPLSKRPLLVVTLCAAALCQRAAGAEIFLCSTVPDYVDSLTQLDKGVAASAPQFAELAAAIPANCTLTTVQGDIVTTTSDIKEKLETLAADNDPQKQRKEVNALRAQLALRIKNAREFSRPIDSTANPKLTDILSSREFRNAKSDDGWRQLKEQIMKWAIRILSRVFAEPEQAVLLIKGVVYSLCALLLVFIVIWIRRWLLSRELRVEPEREYVRFSPSAKRWQQWLEEARAAAQAGDYRQAVHLAYWGAISKLESRGSWRPDKARTPREYLRLLPRGSQFHAPLADITGRFETTWYGHRTPLLQECADFVAKVERI